MTGYGIRIKTAPDFFALSGLYRGGFHHVQWHEKTVEEVLKEFGASRESGLTPDEAARRLAGYGPNKFKEPEKESRFVKFVKQFTEFIILVLMAAAIVAGFLGEWVDAGAIFAIVLLNGVIGFTQEEKAEKVLESLKKLSAPRAKVVRDGALAIVDAASLVPGDVIVFESGDMVPADSRIMEAGLLRIDESPLTGESHPVDKDPGRLTDDIPLAERRNMAYSGTTVVYGRGRAVVVSTGMSTEMGKIARLLEEVKTEPTPMQKKLAEFARLLVYIAGAICGVIFLIGVLRGDALLDMFLIAVSLAVAAIPEGLPAVVTITLAIGVQRMVKRHALIRRLPSVETLGAATFIASDKTGTLTQNQMTVKKVFLPAAEMENVSVSGAGYEPSGEFFAGSKAIDPLKNQALSNLLRTALLCNTAGLEKGEDGKWTVIGDPTEGALLTLAAKAGLKKEDAQKGLVFAGEIPFDAERKMMTAVYRDNAGRWHAFTKGAPERVLGLCKTFHDGNAPALLSEGVRKDVLSTNEEFAASAMRVLAFAHRESAEPIDIHDHRHVEDNLTFLGLSGMMDPPREEVFVAVDKAMDAGITLLMITGDHKTTAVAIAGEIGIFKDNDVAVTGEELDRMGAAEFENLLPRIKVYARVNPEHKLKIVRAWKERGETIAMTGDGVNDAPALKEADIGIAMGITGTDVTKEASDMVLTDDNFASIISAVEEGRGIFDNIRRVVHFLLSCNMGEILVLLVASVAGMPFPLLPVQILWTNLVTDGLPALGLAMEPLDPSVMDRRPRNKKEGIVTPRLLKVMVIQGAFMAACTLAVYAAELYLLGGGLDRARTMAFTVLVFCQKFHVFNCRSERESAFRSGFFTNRVLNVSVGFILVSQIILVYVPWLQTVFKLTPLNAVDWGIVFAASVQPLLWMEVVKWALRRSRA
ncbi:MAG: cation-translocating P-type ATPase [Deltaproteobacteria bacterium]|nr:cation-translocating P-type ATPase [Deltaproteobacteria bacterium]